MSAAAPPPSPVKANPNRCLDVLLNGVSYRRIPVKTPLLTAETNLTAVIEEHAIPLSEPGDILFISEKAVAVTQGRAIPEDQIAIGFTAWALWRFVAKVPYGVGLRRPSSMQCAVNEVGALRIWLAALAGAAGKLAGRKGDFYRVAGPQAAAIDAAGTSPLQPDCVIMAPKDPDPTASTLASAAGIPVAIVDVNDIGGSSVLGASGGVDRRLVEQALKDNPLGQGSECTPMGLLRKQ